jgi:hypothetical protein
MPRHEGDVERVREVDDRLHEPLSRRIAVERSDEGAIDLERVDGQLLQERERGVPGSEVVQCEAHAEPGHAREHCAELLVPAREEALRDLEGERCRRETRVLERLANVIDEHAGRT